MTGSLYVVMGPSGCGKSRTAAALSNALKVPMIEGDDFHSSTNVGKMASGLPLKDADRVAWLDAIATKLESLSADSLVLACSALTPFVQERLRQIPNRHTRFVFLDAPKDVLADRMERRTGHFMPAALLDSQLEALSPPEDALIVDAREPVEEIVRSIRAQLGSGP